MNSANLPEPVLITRPGPLRDLVERLGREPILAVDTESNSLYAYQEQVCLIQFSTPGEDILVDPLALDDLSPLEALFANPEIEKVFHAAEYDLITLKRDFDFTFENLFDTMVAARILGWEEVGLGSILKAEFGVHLDKRNQRANWGQRPLPRELLSYARLDTRYLIPLRARLKEALRAKGLLALAKEDFSRLRHVNGRSPDELPEACWRVSGSYDLSGREAAVLQELCRYRDQVARSLNRPLFKVIGDRTLLSIAAAAPEDVRELRRSGALSPRQLQRHGEALVRAVRRGLKADPIYPPRTSRPEEAYLVRLEALRNWRKQRAREMGVSSDVVLPRDLMFTLAAENPRGEEALAQVLKDVPWRLERFGNEILAVLAGG
ncbi:MAG TPA: HRDC domain-containing protein [Anaerolineales bacterium]